MLITRALIQAIYSKPVSICAIVDEPEYSAAVALLPGNQVIRSSPASGEVH
jgi:hypothetical protein